MTAMRTLRERYTGRKGVTGTGETRRVVELRVAEMGGRFGAALEAREQSLRYSRSSEASISAEDRGLLVRRQRRVLLTGFAGTQWEQRIEGDQVRAALQRPGFAGVLAHNHKFRAQGDHR